MTLTQEIFGTTPQGMQVALWRLGDEGGVRASVLTYGARLARLDVPVGGRRVNVTLGHDSLAGYLADRAYLGAVAGRYANRIGGAAFTLDGRRYDLSANDRGNTLHGGAVGFEQAVWAARADGDVLELRHRSPDGDQGFPGTLDATVRYSVRGDTLAIDYAAVTDAPTVVNLTNHAYFNLDGAGTILDHRIAIPATHFVPVDEKLIPRGAPRAVAGTPFDFQAPQAIGARIREDDDQLRIGGGYDHCYILAGSPAARVCGREIAMEVTTTEPAVQLYTSNMLGAPFGPHAALCLETQHAPDSPNRPDFPSTMLRPGAVFRSRTSFRFFPAADF